jgi:hypothetical protein
VLAVYAGDRVADAVRDALHEALLLRDGVCALVPEIEPLLLLVSLREGDVDAVMLRELEADSVCSAHPLRLCVGEVVRVAVDCRFGCCLGSRWAARRFITRCGVGRPRPAGCIAASASR